MNIWGPLTISPRWHKALVEVGSTLQAVLLPIFGTDIVFSEQNKQLGVEQPRITSFPPRYLLLRGVMGINGIGVQA